MFMIYSIIDSDVGEYQIGVEFLSQALVAL